MRITAAAIAIAVLSISVFAAAQSGYGWRKMGDVSPELHVDFVQGEEVSLEEGIGQHVYIVEFWATWCAPCRYTIPHMNDLQQKYADQGLVVIGVSDESATIVVPYIETRGDEMTYRVAVDPGDITTSRFFHSFGVKTTLPRAFVIDGNGRVAWHGHPAKPIMEEIVKSLLADLPRIAEERAAAEADDIPAPADSDE